MKYLCPVCMFPSMPYPPADYNICPCCSTEFGSDDSAFSHRQLRDMWIASGANWFFGAPPEHWNPWKQLIDANAAELRDLHISVMSFTNNAVIKRETINFDAREFNLSPA